MMMSKALLTVERYFSHNITTQKKRFIYRTSSEPIARSSRYYKDDIIQVRGVITFVTGRLAIQFIGCTLYAPGHALFFFLPKQCCLLQNTHRRNGFLNC